MKKAVYIGQLDRLVNINQIQTTITTTGEKIKSEVLYAQTWTKLDDVSGNENEDGKIIALNVRKYTVRYDNELVQNGTQMSIDDADGTYNIHSVEQIERKNYLILKCSKRE